MSYGFPGDGGVSVPFVRTEVLFYGRASDDREYIKAIRFHDRGGILGGRFCFGDVPFRQTSLTFQT